MTSPPIWLVALLCAVLAPWAARALQAYFERRARQRTQAFLAAVRRRTPPSEPVARDPERPA